MILSKKNSSLEIFIYFSLLAQHLIEWILNDNTLKGILLQKLNIENNSTPSQIKSQINSRTKELKSIRTACNAAKHCILTKKYIYLKVIKAVKWGDNIGVKWEDMDVRWDYSGITLKDVSTLKEALDIMTPIMEFYDEIFSYLEDT